MFSHIFFYQLKNISRKFWIIGWNLLFPLVLATAFHFGFGSMIKDDPNTFHIVPAGYVTLGDYETEGMQEDGTLIHTDPYGEMLESISGGDEEKKQIILLTRYDSEKEANQAILDQEIKGYYLNDGGKISLKVVSTGTDSTILSQIMKQYKTSRSMLERIAKDHPDKLSEAISALSDQNEYLEQHTFGNGVSQYLQYFFALLAMSSLFGSWISTEMMYPMCANISDCGKRFESAPGNRIVAVLAGTLAGTLLQGISNIIVVFYIQYVLQISFGAALVDICLIMFLGSALGIGFGVFFGSVFKKENARVMMPLAFSMVCSFMSGLMVGFMKQVVEDHVPILNRINPASVFTDSLYVISNYGKTDRFYTDVMIMLLMIALTLGVSACILRRRNYASI